jgi:hypothetical protein
LLFIHLFHLLLILRGPHFVALCVGLIHDIHLSLQFEVHFL